MAGQDTHTYRRQTYIYKTIDTANIYVYIVDNVHRTCTSYMYMYSYVHRQAAYWCTLVQVHCTL